MENVRIAILSTYDQVCAFMDNSLPNALHYYSDEVHSYREGAANTFEFTASARHKDSKYLVEGNKLSFVSKQGLLFQYREGSAYRTDSGSNRIFVNVRTPE